MNSPSVVRSMSTPSYRHRPKPTFIKRTWKRTAPRFDVLKGKLHEIREGFFIHFVRLLLFILRVDGPGRGIRGGRARDSLKRTTAYITSYNTYTRDGINLFIELGRDLSSRTTRETIASPVQ